MVGDALIVNNVTDVDWSSLIPQDSVKKLVDDFEACLGAISQ